MIKENKGLAKKGDLGTCHFTIRQEVGLQQMDLHCETSIT